jgi:hypothetical protein
MRPGPSSWEYLMWRAFVGSCLPSSGCPVLRADTRENPVGKKWGYDTMGVEAFTVALGTSTFWWDSLTRPHTA